MPNPPTAAKPTKHPFDPFNSSATGHQRADNSLSGSTSWRESRSLKLREQFRGGTKRISDTVGAGSLDFGQDGRTENGGWVKGAKGLRTGGQRSLFETMGGVRKHDVQGEGVEPVVKRRKVEQDSSRKPTVVVNPYTPYIRPDGKIRESSWTSHESTPSHLLSPLQPPSIEAAPSPPLPHHHHHHNNNSEVEVSEVSPTAEQAAEQTHPQILRNVVIYINGSTAPTISDHKLKHLIVTHGGSMSINLGRRSVTHVILGRPANRGGGGGGGCGGGLAGTKIQKEVSRKAGNSLKFVTADWVIESIKAGKRLPEGSFEAMGFRPVGVGGIGGMFGKRKGAAIGDEVG